MLTSKSALQWLHTWLFTPYSAIGFSIMRIAWGVQEFLTFSFQWPKVHMYYTTTGVLGPIDCFGSNWALSWQFITQGRLNKAFVDSQCLVETVLFTPFWTHIVFATLLTCLIGVIIGYRAKLCILISLLIIISLHHREPHMLNGGDRIEKVIPFFLLIAPSIYAYSVQKAKNLWNQRWVYRLLMWQLVIFYTTAGIHKLEVVGWLNGAMLSISLHLDQFMRWPIKYFTIFEPWYAPMGLVVVGVQVAWIFQLTPLWIRKKIIWRAWPLTLKQTIIAGTASMHLGILFLMDVDMFAVTLLIAYCGLIDEQDILLFKKNWSAILHCRHIFIKKLPSVLAKTSSK